jgi:hypothetical protein
VAEAVPYERVGAGAVLTIDRPERRNAIDGPTAERYEGLNALRQTTVLADRRAAHDGLGLPLADGPAVEGAQRGRHVDRRRRGRPRFAGGEGRGGAGAEV